MDAFVSDSGVALADSHALIFRDGYLYATSASTDAVLRFDGTTGALVDQFVPSGSNSLVTPRGMVFDSSGDLLVSSWWSEVHRYGTTPEAVFTVTISTPSSLPVTVDYSTSANSALAGSDFIASSGTVTFEPGVTSRTILVPTIDDSDAESDETFFVNLSNAVGATILDGSAVGTIVDDEVPNAPPSVDAGANQTLNDDDASGSEAVSLVGTALDSDGTIDSVQWSEGATILGDSNSLNISLSVGVHTLTFTATDDEGDSSSDSVTITVLANQGPTANASGDIAVLDNDNNGIEVVSINGSANDPDGSIVSYQWTEGSTVLGNSASISPTLPIGTHTLTLTVTDNGGAIASDTVVVTVSSAPVRLFCSKTALKLEATATTGTASGSKTVRTITSVRRSDPPTAAAVPKSTAMRATQR